MIQSALLRERTFCNLSYANQVMLIIDTNEPWQIKHELPMELKQNAILQPLDAGDIMLVEDGNAMLIERKTAQDLLNSIMDGRLVDQASRMIEMVKFPVVLCHGDLKCDKEGKVVADGRSTRFSWWSLHMGLLSLQAGGVIYLQVRKQDLPDTIRYLQKWLVKESHLIVSKREPMPFFAPKKGTTILASLPNIGMEKAKVCMDFYGKAGHAIAEMTCLDNCKLPKGVAQGTVKKVREALGLDDWEKLSIESIGEDDE